MTLLACACLFAAGIEAAPVRAVHASVELLAAAMGVTPGTDLPVGIRVKLDPGWHIYWVNPGEAGMPTAVRWELPDGFSAGDLQWPTPKRFVSEGIVSFGYSGEVVLLSLIRVPAGFEGTMVELKAKVSMLLCKDICVPGSAEVASTLPVLEAPAEANAEAFRSARAALPHKPEGWQVSCSRKGNALELSVVPTGNEGQWTAVEFFPQKRNLLAVSGATGSEETEQGYTVTLPLSPLAGAMPDGLRGVLVYEEDGRRKAVLIDGEIVE